MREFIRIVENIQDFDFIKLDIITLDRVHYFSSIRSRAIRFKFIDDNHFIAVVPDEQTAKEIKFFAEKSKIIDIEETKISEKEVLSMNDEIEENADSDNMHGDATKKVHHFTNRRSDIEFGSKGRADMAVKANDPRFSDNPMTIDEDGEDEFDSNDSQDTSHLDQLHSMLTRTGLTDLEIRQGIELSQDGKRKVAGKLGINPEEVDILVNSLTQELRDADSRSTDALIDDYYSMMNEDDDEEDIGSTLEDDMIDTADKTSNTYDNISGLDEEEHSFVKHEEQDEWMPPNDDKDAFTPHFPSINEDWGMKRKVQKTTGDVAGETKRPFDLSVMERFSYEKDSSGNVTIRDSETGNEKYLQGSKAANFLLQISNGADENALLGNFLSESLGDHDEKGFDDEINATSGTYNFPWKYKGENGFGTAFFKTHSDKPDISVSSIRDHEGNEIKHMDSRMRNDILDQAYAFIGNE